MGCPPLAAGKTTGAVLVLRTNECKYQLKDVLAAPAVERTRERIGQCPSTLDVKTRQAYTGGYSRKVSSCARESMMLVIRKVQNGVPLMTAFKYFISRKSSNVGLLELPTTVRISSRSL